MSIDETVSFSLEVNVEEAMTNLRRALTLLYRTLGLMRRLGLSENMEFAVTTMQRTIAVMNQLRLAALALQAASGPIGWALAAVGIAGTVVSGVDLGNNIYDGMRGT